MLSRWWWWSAGLSLSVAGLGLIGIWWTASRLSKPIESFARSVAELAGNERALDRVARPDDSPVQGSRRSRAGSCWERRSPHQ